MEKDSMGNFHKSVLLEETIGSLQIKPGEKYIDATLGGGGHSFEILKHGGKVLGLDADQEALDFVEGQFKIQNSRFKIGKELVLVKGNFRDIDKIAKENNFELVAGAVFDLGVSSHQLDSQQRGFSFQSDGPLDMRMDRDLSIKAADLVNVLGKNELTELFTKFGEEKFAKRIADAIVDARKANLIKTTMDLSEVVRRVVPMRGSKINPATRIFQALRIAVNDELDSLKTALPKVFELLAPKGRLAVISFHSIEDRIVKQQFREWMDKGIVTEVTRKPVVPSLSEIEENYRSRSAKLRVIEKV